MTASGHLYDRARWYATRLRSMPLPEIPYRMLEAVKRCADRRGKFAARYTHASDTLRRLPVPSFPLDLDTLRGAGEGDRVRIASQARDILGDRLVLLGQRWPVGARTDWALDPVSGSHWEWDRLCFDIDRRLGGGPGDVKFTWELSRLQHLQVLALDVFLSGSEAARKACVDDLSAWIAGNPPFRGLGYACGVELSSRVLSVLVVVALLGPGSLSSELSRAIWDMLNAHGAWLARYPSLYSSANNHLVAEATGLFAVGSLAPELPEAAAWRTMGREHLEREAARQITADGVGAEQSPSYQAYTMEWLLVARRIAAATGQRLDPVIDHGYRPAPGSLPRSSMRMGTTRASATTTKAPSYARILAASGCLSRSPVQSGRSSVAAQAATQRIVSIFGRECSARHVFLRTTGVLCRQPSPRAAIP